MPAAMSAMPQKLLFLSDMHIGGSTSNFAAYQAKIIDLMSHYDHVVMNGDAWELFYVDRHHVKALSHLLETLTERDAHHWKTRLDDTGDIKSGVKNVIHGAKWFTSEFLEKFLDIHLHFVGGNHENVRRFRHAFEAIQQQYPNFEWSPEAIRIGDALVTHGHLPLRGKTLKEEGEGRLRIAEAKGGWAKLVEFLPPLEQQIQPLWRNRDCAARTVKKQLEKWSGSRDFSVSHHRLHEPFELGWVRHVFFGHTHIKFDNRAEKDILLHNTGAIVRATSQHPEDLGILEAELHADGTIRNVRPVRIAKDPDMASRRRPREHLASACR